MPRNAEVIRQWNILLHLDRCTYGASVDELARLTGKGKRTIWRDLQALQEAGFALTSERRDDSRTYWMLINMPLKSLHNPGLSITEICSLYMSRALLSAMPGAAFADGLANLMGKIEKALSPRVRAFLDDLPGVIKVKPGARKKQALNHGAIVSRLVEASTNRHVSTMTYFSASSNREKVYEVHPYHVSYFDGGLYLSGWVPEYRQVRHFAVERIRAFTEGTRPFVPKLDKDGNPFAESLGVNQGTPERVEVEFAGRVAHYIRERDWHPSQQVTDQQDGSVRLTLMVCTDWALRSWILGFGPDARVVSPARLAEEILTQLSRAQDGYAPRLALESPPRRPSTRGQPALPMS